MPEGFCLTHQQDVPISADARCLTDDTRTIAPSTGCLHQRWIDGAWSECQPYLRGQDSKPCKPKAAGTWRNVLAQTERVIARRARDKAARQFSAMAPQAPKLKDAHKPAHTVASGVSAATPPSISSPNPRIKSSARVPVPRGRRGASPWGNGPATTCTAFDAPKETTPTKPGGCASAAPALNVVSVPVSGNRRWQRETPDWSPRDAADSTLSCVRCAVEAPQEHQPIVFTSLLHAGPLAGSKGHRMTARAYLPMTDRQLTMALADTSWRGDDSADGRGFKDAGVASRERTIDLVVEHAAASESAEEVNRG